MKITKDLQELLDNTRPVNEVLKSLKRKNTVEFTEKQLENFEAFVEVQMGSLINMADARSGCQMTGMERDEWTFCMSNYSELEKASKDLED